MAYYTTPTNNDTKGIFEFFNYVNNSASEGIFFPIIIFVIWIITFAGTKQYSTPKAWTFASFLCSILSIFLSIMSFISPNIMYVFIIFFAVGLVWVKLDNQ